jgi:hypothetical protein
MPERKEFDNAMVVVSGVPEIGACRMGCRGAPVRELVTKSCGQGLAIKDVQYRLDGVALIPLVGVEANLHDITIGGSMAGTDRVGMTSVPAVQPGRGSSKCSQGSTTAYHLVHQDAWSDDLQLERVCMW